MRRLALAVLALGGATIVGCHDSNEPLGSQDNRPIYYMTLPTTTMEWQIARSSPKPASGTVMVSGARESPSIDRSGTRLAFVAPDGIYVANPDGSNATLVPGVSGNRLSWSPDGTRLAVGKRYGDFYPSVVIVTLATGHLDTLHLASGLLPAAATWSPDGSRLLVEVGGTTAGAGILSTRADGSDARVVVPPPRTSGFGWVRDASWSPDGRGIVYAQSDSTGSDIWTAAADGSNPGKLSTPPGFFKVEPVWSPSGKAIAFSYQAPGGPYDVMVVPLDGTPPWTVSSNLEWGGTHPSW